MKKTMRKSALLSSVAMLIVSAIVLTSATYAWFSASNRVEVTEISATVESSSGLLISIDDGASWKTKVDVSGKKPGNFSPVSSATGASGSWVAGAYKDEVLKLDAAIAGPAEGAQYMAYNLWVKGPVTTPATTVTVTPNFDGTDENVKKVLKFALYDTTANKWLNGGVIAADGSTTGYNGTSATGDISGADETNGAYTVTGTPVSEVSGYSFDLTGTHKFIAYVWVEGNDVDCKAEDIASGSDVVFALEMTIPE